jgi:hypothetical protein
MGRRLSTNKINPDSRIFGIGLSKTGTTSLTRALNLLGIPSIHFPHDQTTYAELRRGEYRLSILETYRGVTDTPVSPYFAQLDKVWPESKFILTVREMQSWLKSAERHWEAVLGPRRAADPDFREYVDFIDACTYGCTEFAADRFRYVSDRHTRDVTEYFAAQPEKLLVLDICGGTGGWEQLADFLGVEAPKGIPFPHEYRSGGWSQTSNVARKEMEKLIASGDSAIVIDDEALGPEFLAERKLLPFLEKDGQYWGSPENDETAIEELERLKADSSARFLVLAWPAFWWRDQYPRFFDHVDARYECLERNERFALWSLS